MDFPEFEVPRLDKPLPRFSLRDETPRGTGKAEGFLGKLEDALKEVDSLQKEADAAVVGFAAGKVQDIHTVALALKKAELSFRFLLAVRRKVVEAYQELTRLNV